MSDIQRWGLSTKWINQLRWVKSKTGSWYKVADVEVDRKADRDRIKELETRLTTIEKAVEMSDSTANPESYILVDNDEISLAIYGPLLQFTEEPDSG